jgi:hypothetical protein
LFLLHLPAQPVVIVQAFQEVTKRHGVAVPGINDEELFLNTYPAHHSCPFEPATPPMGKSPRTKRTSLRIPAISAPWFKNP